MYKCSCGIPLVPCKCLNCCDHREVKIEFDFRPLKGHGPIICDFRELIVNILYLTGESPSGNSSRFEYRCFPATNILPCFVIPVYTWFEKAQLLFSPLIPFAQISRHWQPGMRRTEVNSIGSNHENI